jgi:hypothetical protein
MKFEDLKKINETIVTMDVKGKPYALVNERIKAFRMLYPEGTILTEIVGINEGVCIMKATIKNGDLTLGTGTAYEKENSTFINKTSYIENCETSAVGRALAMCGIGIDTSIASAEEVQNAINNQNNRLELLSKISKLMSEKKVLPNEVSEHFGKSSSEMNDEELKEVIKWLEGINGR